MLQYMRWLWKEAPRALRVEFLITVLLIEALALATMLVLTSPLEPAPPLSGDESSVHIK
jgi:hypothetical protein